ncbi:unnamed protein product, partial [Durusdinium trenchii]
LTSGLSDQDLDQLLWIQTKLGPRTSVKDLLVRPDNQPENIEAEEGPAAGEGQPGEGQKQVQNQPPYHTVVGKDGEVTAYARASGLKFVIAPKGAPVSMIYRQCQFHLMLAGTNTTSEQLGLAWQYG